MILGCIADDVTGATDLALMLSKNGMRVLQILGVPSGDAPSNSDAIVIALKTRTAQKNSAVNKSVESAKWLKEAGAGQFFIKYCSTFDSTEEGNIGPVSEALLDFLESSFTVVCPAFPENGRTVYMGHLFVHGQLLSESSMKDHPLTPMRDANLIRFLGKQLSDANSVGLISIGTVTLGPSAIRSRINELKQDGYRFAVIDAIEDKHLLSIADACSEMKLITGGSAVAMGLPGNYRRSGILPIQSSPLEMPKLLGPVAILSGSCSTATQEQIRNLSEKVEGIFLDPISLENGGEEYFKSLLGQVELALSQGVVLVYSTSSPDKVGMIQASLG
ncbi:MAG: four-carbon acid sugar kinase family protein, partial [Anaerolineales bacterium]|nr:four-carbon acid sugar kinase family protein [Anaerolineales bacterium]